MLSSAIEGSYGSPSLVQKIVKNNNPQTHICHMNMKSERRRSVNSRKYDSQLRICHLNEENCFDYYIFLSSFYEKLTLTWF